MSRKQRRAGLKLVPKPRETRPFHVQVNVKRGVAKFIRQHKKQWHTRGAHHFDLPFGVVMPPWMAVVIETIRLRKKTWRVEEFTPTGFDGIRYRITWLGFLKFTRRRR